MVTKSDWKAVEMPEENCQFVLERKLTNDDVERIKQGHLPKEMEDKWFMYYEDGKLFIHRSWTGFCIFIVTITTDGTLPVIANRNPAQYRGTSASQDCIEIKILLDMRCLSIKS